MNQDQIRLLTKMKTLIYDGRRKFETRRDRDYLQDLLDLGISEKCAWNDHIMSLNNNMYWFDAKTNYVDTRNTLLFKKIIDGVLVYIKIKLEYDLDGKEMVVCLSFHEDRK